MRTSVLLFALFFALAGAARAKTFEARVIGVVDGDTIDVLVGSDRERVRLQGIDAPERDQPWGARAKQALSARVFGKSARIDEHGLDDHGRVLGDVSVDGACVACELVREGSAWVYRAYSDDPALIALEEEARAAKRGLWSLPEYDRVPPWKWRRAAKQVPEAEPEKPQLEIEGRGCARKTSCSEMQSCAEARFYLWTCGVAALDSDGDGVPCEDLCR
jgi:endonuclease YncB( thermonuclease family)